MRLGRASVGKTPQVKNPFYLKKKSLLHLNPFLMPNANFSKEMKLDTLIFQKRNGHGAGDGLQWILMSGGSSGGST